MTLQSADTSADAERVRVALLRAMPVWKRLAQVDALREAADTVALAELRRQAPDATERELLARLIDRRKTVLAEQACAIEGTVAPTAGTEG